MIKTVRKCMTLWLFLLMVMNVSATTEDIVILGSVGKLSAVIRKPTLKAGEQCPMVIIMHGFGGDKSNFAAIGEGLEQNGIASICFDFNGHGSSEGAFQDMTVPNEIADAKKVYEYVRGLNYVNRIALVGHSQGGVVAGMTAGELGTEAISYVVLLAPAAVLREDAIRGSTFGVSYNPLDPPEYVALPNNLKLGREYIRTAFTLPIYETSEKYQGPACLIHGTGDRIVPYTYSVLYHKIWSRSELHIIDGLDHGFSQDYQKVVDLAVKSLTDHLK